MNTSDKGFEKFVGTTVETIRVISTSFLISKQFVSLSSRLLIGLWTITSMTERDIHSLNPNDLTSNSNWVLCSVHKDLEVYYPLVCFPGSLRLLEGTDRKSKRRRTTHTRIDTIKSPDRVYNLIPTFYRYQNTTVYCSLNLWKLCTRTQNFSVSQT